MFLISPYQVAPPGTLIGILQSLGLTTNLQVCLDAGDINSYSGTGQTWNDTSGNGYNFNRGTTTSSETSDPTFNGAAGHESSSEYFSVDGGDWFTIGQTNPTWVQQMHKAGGKFTVVEWAFANSVSATKFYAGFGDANTGAGIVFGSDFVTGLGLELTVLTATTNVLDIISTAKINNNAWNMVGVAVDASAPSETFVINGATEAHSTSYSSPSSSSAGFPLQIGAVGNNSGADTSGNRFGMVAVWDRALSAAELSSLYGATRAKYGI